MVVYFKPDMCYHKHSTKMKKKICLLLKQLPENMIKQQILVNNFFSVERKFFSAKVFRRNEKDWMDENLFTRNPFESNSFLKKFNRKSKLFKLSDARTENCKTIFRRVIEQCGGHIQYIDESTKRNQKKKSCFGIKFTSHFTRTEKI